MMSHAGGRSKCCSKLVDGDHALKGAANNLVDIILHIRSERDRIAQLKFGGVLAKEDAVVLPNDAAIFDAVSNLAFKFIR